MFMIFISDSHINTPQLLDNTTSSLSTTAYGSICIDNETRLTECLVDFIYCVPDGEQATAKCIPIGRYC